MRNLLEKKRIDLGIVGVFWLFYTCFYIYLCGREMPMETLFDQFSLIEKLFSNTLTFKDLLVPYSEHGMLASNLIFLFNVRYLHLFAQLDIYINCINVALTCAILIHNIRKSFNGEHTVRYYIAVILCAFFMTTILQESARSMFTQVKLGFLSGIIAMHMCNRVLQEKKSWIYLLGTAAVIFLSINFFGTLYSFAFVPALFLALLIRAIKNKRIGREEWVIGGTYAVSCCLYLFEYGFLSGGQAISVALDKTTSSFSVINAVKGLFAYAGNMLLGYPIIADNLISATLYKVVGVVALLIIIFAIWRYLAMKMYEETWMPMLLIGYSFCVYILLTFGRASDMWLANSWYTVQTIPTAVSTIWIITKDTAAKKWLKSVGMAGLACLLLVGLVGTAACLRRAPYAKAWGESRVRYLFAESIEDLPVDASGNTPLFHSPEATMDCINLMKKYNLSIYRNYSDYQALHGSKDKPVASAGVFGDGWVSDRAAYKLITTSHDKVVLKGYYNRELTGNEVIEFRIDGETVMEFTLESSNFEVEIPVGADQECTLEIIPNFAVAATPPDARVISFILNSIAYTN